MTNASTITTVYVLTQNGTQVGAPYPTLALAEAAALANPGTYEIQTLTQDVVTAATAPPPVITPPPVVTPPAAGTSWVYSKGKMLWAGDWSDVTVDYASTASTGVDGVSPCIAIPAGPSFEYWLPFPPATPGAPAANGIGYDLSGKTKFTIAIKPTKAGMVPTMGFYIANSATNDIPAGNTVSLAQAKYGPATMVAGQWNVYTVPLSDYAVSGWIYKFIIQEQGSTPQALFIDQVGFS
jgi:hypothetical protein